MNCINIEENYLNSLSVFVDSRLRDLRVVCFDSEKNVVYKIINECFLCNSVDDFIEKLKIIKNNKLLKKLNFILPEDLIYIDGKFRGYTMTYFKSERLDAENNYNHFLIWLENIQKRLEYNIIFDINFRNFLIDKHNNVMICDVDSMQINRFNLTFFYFAKFEYVDFRTSKLLIARVLEIAVKNGVIEFDEFLKKWISRAENYKSVLLSQLINHLKNI